MQVAKLLKSSVHGKKGVALLKVKNPAFTRQGFLYVIMLCTMAMQAVLGRPLADIMRDYLKYPPRINIINTIG